jgi:hypothetical protein
MFWEMYLNRSKLIQNGEIDVRFACQIAQWEGIMNQALLKGDNETYKRSQNRIRNWFEREMPKENIPKELTPGNFPEKIEWPD